MSRKPDRTGRSKGEGKHIRIYRWEFDSPAYRSLCAGARALLAELKMLHHPVYNPNGNVFLSCRDAAVLVGVNKDTALGLFEKLQARGFIRPKEKGAFEVKLKKATTWILTEYEYAGALPTKDFMRWRPGHDFPVEPRRPPKNKRRSPETGQTVRNGGTNDERPVADCPSKPDNNGEMECPVGPLDPDTIRTPGRGESLRSREASSGRTTSAVLKPSSNQIPKRRRPKRIDSDKSIAAAPVREAPT